MVLGIFFLFPSPLAGCGGSEAVPSLHLQLQPRPIWRIRTAGPRWSFWPAALSTRSPTCTSGSSNWRGITCTKRVRPRGLWRTHSKHGCISLIGRGCRGFGWEFHWLGARCGEVPFTGILHIFMPADGSESFCPALRQYPNTRYSLTTLAFRLHSP